MDAEGRAFYFGCWGDTGHYLFRPNGSTAYERGPRPEVRLPWKYLDGTLPPHGNPVIEEEDGGRRMKETPRDLQVQSRAALHHKGGWTALSMWDRSVDERYGSNSNFFVEGTHTFTEVVPLIERHFPRVWRRINDKLKVTLHPGGLRV